MDRPDRITPTDTQKKWTRSQMEDLDACDGDWIVITGASRARRYALADTVEDVATHDGMRIEVFCVPPKGRVRMVSHRTMAAEYHWHDTRADLDATAPGTTTGRMPGKTLTYNDHLSLSRMSISEHDILMVQCDDDDLRTELADAFASALDRRGQKTLLIEAPKDFSLHELSQSEATIQAMEKFGWAQTSSPSDSPSEAA